MVNPSTERPEAPIQLAQEMLGKDGNVLAPLAQRRKVYGEHAQAIEEVAAKTAAFHVGLKVAVRRRDGAHVTLRG